MPLTVVLPTVDPPVVHVVGAVACGPNTLNVIVPLASLVAPARVELIELGGMAAAVASVAGPEAVVVVAPCTTSVNAA